MSSSGTDRGMEQHPELGRLLLDAREAEQAKASAQLRHALDRIHAIEGSLRASEQRYETARKEADCALRSTQIWLAAQKEAFQAAMNGASLRASLGILIDTAVEQTNGDRRCAFYIADANGTALRHVVGMPESYAQHVDGLAISAESLACGLAIATGEPVITPDVLEEPRWRPWTWLAREYDYRGCWSFPVETSTEKRVGTLAMYFTEPREPTASDRDLAAVLNQTAAFIIAQHQQTDERTRIHRELVKSQQDLAAELAAAQRLQSVSTELASGQDIQSLYDKLIGAAMFIMRADFASMQVISTEHGAGRHLRLLTFHGFSPRAAKFWKCVQVDSSSTCGLALKSGQRAVIRDVANSDVLAGTDDLAMYLETGIRAVQSTPLVSRSGELLGMISTHWRNPHQPAERDLRLLDILARQAADVIERTGAEAALRESEARFREFGEASSDVLWVRDAEALQWEYVSPAFETIYGVARKDILKGNNLEHWAALIVPADRERAVENLRRVRGGERVTHEFRIRRRSDSEIRWIRNTDFPLLDQSGRVQRIGGIGQDVTGEKATGDRLQVMVAELQHRTRNLIAVVRSMVAQTMAMTGPTEAFRHEFNHRLEALARVQGLLSRSDETPITLERLIRIELDALGMLEGANGRVTLQGPSVRLRSSIVQTLSLAVHELATNARKHGALANGDGRLSVTWQVHQAAEGPRLALEWIETTSGTRIDTSPARRGYGRELIEEALPYSLGATTTYELSAEGARCIIDMPLERPRRKRAG